MVDRYQFGPFNSEDGTMSLMHPSLSPTENLVRYSDYQKLESALRKIVRDSDYTAPEGMKRIAQEALASELETAVEREECPQCGGQGHIKVYADGVFQKAIDCGMCSAPNRGVKHGT